MQGVRDGAVQRRGYSHRYHRVQGVRSRALQPVLGPHHREALPLLQVRPVVAKGLHSVQRVPQGHVPRLQRWRT